MGSFSDFFSAFREELDFTEEAIDLSFLSDKFEVERLVSGPTCKRKSV